MKKLGRDVREAKLCIIFQPLMLDSDYEKESLSPKLIFFDDVISQSGKDILKPLMKIKNSNIFQELWVKAGKSVRQRLGKDKDSVLNLDQVTSDVWKTACDRVQDIYKRLESGDMPLREVKKLFNDIGANPELLKREMRILSGGENTGWIDERFEQMRRYSQLEKFRCGAHAVLKARETLSLTGNFDTLKNIIAVVNTIYIVDNDLSTCQCCEPTVYCLWRIFTIRVCW